MALNSGILYKEEQSLYSIREYSNHNCLLIARDYVGREDVPDGEDGVISMYKYDEYVVECPLDPKYRNLTAIEFIALVKEKVHDATAQVVREQRNKLLQSSDKYMTVDRGLNIDLPTSINMTSLLSAVKDFFDGLRECISGDVATYRQALRDLPDQEGFPYNVTFPDKPSVIDD